MKRGPNWKWWVSALLLSATMINYMDRQTLANLSVRVTKALGLTEEQYGTLELGFGWAFAAGSFVFGWLADQLALRWLYPSILLGWSLAGILTGLVSDYPELLMCRILLGFFEAGHWPCALKTVQRVMLKQDRHFGNSLLQSGAAIGAIVTPPIILAILALFDRGDERAWSIPFIVIGLAGTTWIVGWFLLIGPQDLVATEEKSRTESGWAIAIDRRVWALLVMVITINTTWQILRAWLPKYLQQGRGYSEATSLWFNSAFYIVADIGCILSGAIALRLAKRGYSQHSSSVWVYGGCAGITALAVLLGFVPNGVFLFGLLLIIGAGALGLFPCYYTFCQEISETHLGKMSGIVAGIGWIVSSPMQKLYGRHIDATQSFEWGLALAGLMPSIGLLALLLLWRRNQK